VYRQWNDNETENQVFKKKPVPFGAFSTNPIYFGLARSLDILGKILATNRPSVGTVQFQHIHTSGRQQESMTIPKAAHTVL
jgi:hypothetical protein